MKHFKLTLALIAAFMMVSSGLFAQEEAKKSDTLAVIGQIQVRGQTFEQDGGHSYEDFNFYIPRYRFGFKYDDADKFWGAFFYTKKENDINGAGSDSANFYAFGWINPVKGVTIYAGDKKIPFNRENQRSSANHYVDNWGGGTQPVAFAVNSLKTEMFDQGVGVDVKMIPNLLIQLNMSNGSKAGVTGGGDRTSFNSNTTPLWTGYVNYQILGKYRTMGTEIFDKGMGLNVGAGFGITSFYEAKVFKYTDENGDKNVYSNGVEDWSGYTFDLSFWTMGLVLNANIGIYKAKVDYSNVGLENVTTDELNYMLEIGYYLPMGSWGIMPAFRYESSTQSYDEEGYDDYVVTDLKFGLNFYLASKGKSKVSVFFYQTKKDNGTNETTDSVFEFQYQTLVNFAIKGQ